MSLYDQLRHKVPLVEQLKSQSSYRQQIRSAVRGLWTGELDITDFILWMQDAIDNGFNAAWKEGMASVGLQYPEDMTSEEQNALRLAIYDENQYIFGFGEAIEQGSKANGGKLGTQFQRVELWVKRYLNLVNQARQMAQNDPVLEWMLSAKESCTSCLRLNGQRRRASVWAASDLRPQHPNKLNCMISAGGVDVCKCQLVPTDQPPTRGRIPRVP